MNQAQLRAAAPFLILLAVALALLVMAAGFDSPEAAGRLGPGAWPTAVSALLAVLAAFKALSVAQADPAAEQPAPLSGAEPLPAGQLEPWRAISALAVFAAYCLVLDTLGFPLATALLLGSFLIVAGYRKPLPLVATALGGSVLLFLAFRIIVYVSLPLGVGPFQSLTLGLLALFGAA